MDSEKSIYSRAALWGLPMGLYMSVLSVMLIYADRVQALSLPALLMILCWPLVLGRFQYKRIREDGGKDTTSSLWMLGIVVVLCGALITSVITFATLQWLRPTYFADQVANAISIYEQTPQLKNSEVMHLLKEMQQNHYAPQPIEIVMQMFWTVSSVGCVVSLLTGAVARAVYIHRLFGGKIHNDN